MPQRIQMTRQRPWRKDNPDAVIVARPTKWGNPYRIGDLLYPDAAAAVRRFRAAVIGFWSNGSFCRPDAHPDSYIGRIIRDAPIELHGKDLACWCPLADAEGKPVPCHADVLLELANTTTHGE